MMGISYKPLWRLLLEKDMNKTELMRAIGLSPPTLAKLSKNEPVDGKVLERICLYFKCQPADVIEYLHVESPNT
ncbi:MAG: helix-turn-helix transcriptional regulator [Treponema sp.]|jgi:DNA-binding Xre family transcriptional regulator|nr:helix-turn-helix transcriptional regulator [Treponema sp.]